MGAQIKAVVFDVGNVIVHWSPRFLYEKLIKDAEELDFFLSNVVTVDWHGNHDRGMSFADNIAARAKEFPEYTELLALYDTRWAETIKGRVAGVASLIEDLVDQEVPIYGLTNFPAEKWPDFRLNYPVTDLFSGFVVSGQEKVAKPDPRIFQTLVSRYKLDPETTFFTDDSAANIASASHLGFHTLQFIGARGLEYKLIELGLI